MSADEVAEIADVIPQEIFGNVLRIGEANDTGYNDDGADRGFDAMTHAMELG